MIETEAKREAHKRLRLATTEWQAAIEARSAASQKADEATVAWAEARAAYYAQCGMTL